MIKKGRVVFLDLLKRLPIMPVGRPLPKWGVIVYAPNSTNQVIVQRLNKNFNTAFLGSPYILTAFLRQSRPPLCKASCSDSCDAVPFSMMVILRVGDGKFLCKGQTVGAHPCSSLTFQ